MVQAGTIDGRNVFAAIFARANRPEGRILTVKKLFATKNATTVTSTYTDYTFSLTGGELYTIASGDRIGIKYTGGNANNYAAVMLDRDAADPFDGSNSYRQQYITSLGSYPVDDMYMMLKQTHG